MRSTVQGPWFSEYAKGSSGELAENEPSGSYPNNSVDLGDVLGTCILNAHLK